MRDTHRALRILIPFLASSLSLSACEASPKLDSEPMTAPSDHEGASADADVPLTPAQRDRRDAIAVAHEAVRAALVRDADSFRRSIDAFVPDGLTADLSKADRYRFAKGHHFDQPPAPEDTAWIERQWERYRSQLASSATHALGAEADIADLFRSAEAAPGAFEGQMRVHVMGRSGARMTLVLRKGTDEVWRVGTWTTSGSD